MPGLALMTYSGPVYITSGQSWRDDISSSIVPHIKNIRLEAFLPTIDEIQQHECAVTMLMLKNTPDNKRY